MNQQANQWITPARDLASLLAFDNEALVECAYMTMLRRMPDLSGLDHYCHRLSSGHSKLEILRDIYASDEARAIDLQIPWLARALWIYKMTTFSPTRLLPKLFSNRSSKLARRIGELEARISAIERTLSSLSENQKESKSRPKDVMKEGERQVQLIAQISRQPESGRHSVLAARVYRELLDSRARVEADTARQFRRDPGV